MRDSMLPSSTHFLRTDIEHVWIVLTALFLIRIAAAVVYYITANGLTSLGQWILTAAFVATVAVGTMRAVREPDSQDSIGFRYLMPLTAVPFLIGRTDATLIVATAVCAGSIVSGQAASRRRGYWVTALVLVPALLAMSAIAFLGGLNTSSHETSGNLVSPNGLWVARPYYFETGAWGRNEWWVDVEPRLFPFVSKRVYFGEDDSMPRIEWGDGLTLTVRGQEVELLGPPCTDFDY